jgi:hypothetical protein
MESDVGCSSMANIVLRGPCRKERRQTLLGNPNLNRSSCVNIRQTVRKQNICDKLLDDNIEDLSTSDAIILVRAGGGGEVVPQEARTIVLESCRNVDRWIRTRWSAHGCNSFLPPHTCAPFLSISTTQCLVPCADAPLVELRAVCTTRRGVVQ